MMGSCGQSISGSPSLARSGASTGVPLASAASRFVEDLLQLEQQLLRSADTERRNEHRALVGQSPLDGSLQPLAAVRAILVAAVAIGAFENQQIGALGRYQVRQQR